MKALCIFLSSLWIASAATAQFTNTYGYSFNNPTSATLNSLMWESMNSRLVYRVGLKRKGFTDAQLNNMTTEQLREAYMTGKIPGKKPAAKPAATPPPATPATQFKPSGNRILMPKLVDSLTDNPEHRKALKDLFGQQLNAYDAEAKKAGLANDLSGAIAFFAGVTLQIQDGKEPNEGGLKLLAKAIQLSMETPAVRKIPNAEKQKFNEFLVTMGNYLLVAVDEVDDDTKAQMKQVASDVLKKYTGIDATKVKLTANGLEKR